MTPDAATVPCPICDTPLAPTWRACPGCGTPLTWRDGQPVPRPIATPIAAPPNEPAPPPPQVVYVQAPPPPPVPKRRSGCSIIVGLVLVIIVLSIIGSILNPTPRTPSSGSPASGSTGSTAAQATGTAAALPIVGESVTVGSWKVTVEGASTAAVIDWSGVGNKETAKGKFVIVQSTVENTTKKTDQVNSFDYKLLDSTDTTYDALDNFVVLGGYARLQGRETFLSDIPPRTPTKFVAIFDAAKDAQGLILQIENTTKIRLGNLR